MLMIEELPKLKQQKQLTSQVQSSKGWNRHVNPEGKNKWIKSDMAIKYLLVTPGFKKVSACDYLLSSPSSSFL